MPTLDYSEEVVVPQISVAVQTCNAGWQRMDIEKTLSELREERDQVDRAILSLERLAKARGRTGGTSPAWIAALPAKRRGRPPGSKHKHRPPTSNSPTYATRDLPQAVDPFV